jgi:hypothetical protein
MATGMATMMAGAGTIEDLLRLAWQMGAEGKPGLRDALMTLVVAESGPGEAVLAERCRRLLVARQPDHWFATTATLGQALVHPKVSGALAKLRAMFPPVRVQRLLLRFDAAHGPFTGGPTPLERVLQGLSLVPEKPSAAVSEPAEPVGGADRRPPSPRALRFPGAATPADPDGSIGALYFAVLLAMAVLLEGVTDQQATASATDTRAA